jgi:hypothetical protein
MSYTNHLHRTARFTRIPTGDRWEKHVGKKPPVSDNTYVEIITKTDEGYAISPRMRAERVKEHWPKKKDEDGAVLRWRLADMTVPESRPAQQPLPHLRPAEEIVEPPRPARRRWLSSQRSRSTLGAA